MAYNRDPSNLRVIPSLGLQPPSLSWVSLREQGWVSFDERQSQTPILARVGPSRNPKERKRRGKFGSIRADFVGKVRTPNGHRAIPLGGASAAGSYRDDHADSTCMTR